jgi:hypothetical protein
LSADSRDAVPFGDAQKVNRSSTGAKSGDAFPGRPVNIPSKVVKVTSTVV